MDRIMVYNDNYDIKSVIFTSETVCIEHLTDIIKNSKIVQEFMPHYVDKKLSENRPGSED